MPPPPTPLSDARGGDTATICIIGSGTRFLSGISYYTHRLAHALAASHPVSVILMRQLLPTRLYPGRARVGKELVDLDYAPLPVHDGVDWFWVPSLADALRLLREQKPDVVVFQWWTGTVLHTYLLLAWIARRRGARVVIEFHEALDTGEDAIPFVSSYVRLGSRGLMALTDGFVVHSRQDLEPLRRRYGLGGRPAAVIPHGPYDQYWGEDVPAREPEATTPDAACHLLYFGVIRSYKGVDDLLLAFDALPPDQAARFHLTIVGETWEGWTRPAQLVAESRNRDRITFVNRYVADDEVAGFFAAADAVVLPYRRSAASGPLHIAMAHGLPVVITEVGGLPEAVAGYEGAVRVPPQDPAALSDALLRVRELAGRRFDDPHSWEATVAGYGELFERILR